MASKMTNTKWGVLIAAGFFLDALEWLLDAAVVGVVANPVIDFGISFALPWYLNKQGVKLTTRKIVTWVATGALETFLAGVIPLWGLDILLTMLWDKADKALEIAPQPVQNVASQKASAPPTTNKDKVVGHIEPARDKKKLSKAA